MRSFLPNFITCLNLLCGCLAITFAFNENLLLSAYLLGIAAVLDFLDGFAARLLNGHSELGKQLDSLADMVTFGLLPGVILFQHITISLGNYGQPFSEIPFSDFALAGTGFLITIAAALRLGKFNIAPNESSDFLGLPTPAVGLLVATVPFILGVHYNMNFYYPPTEGVMEAMAKKYHWYIFEYEVVELLFSPYFFVSLSAVLAVLMLAPINIFSLKVKSLKWKENKIRYIFLIQVVLLGLLTGIPYFFSYWDVVRNFIFLDYLSIPIVILLYIITASVYGILVKTVSRKKRNG